MYEIIAHLREIFQNRNLNQGLLQDLPLDDDEVPPATDAQNALGFMRVSEGVMRARLRFLQVARLEGWEVANHFAKAKGGTTEDPDLVEARKAAVKHKKEKDTAEAH